MATFVGHRTIAALHVIEKPSSKALHPRVSPAKAAAPSSSKTTKSKIAFSHLVVRAVAPSLSADGTFMEYDIEMANTRNGMVWNLRKRFSAFLELHRQVEAVFDTTHSCAHCSLVADQTADLELPPKKWSLRLFGAPVVDAGMAAMRARLFATYITALVEIGAHKPLQACPVVAESYRPTVLAFLTTPSVFMEMHKIKLVSRAKVAIATGVPKLAAPSLPPRRGSKKAFKTLETILESDNSSQVVIIEAASC